MPLTCGFAVTSCCAVSAIIAQSVVNLWSRSRRGEDSSLRYRSGGWDLRYRERSGKGRTHWFRRTSRATCASGRSSSTTTGGPIRGRSASRGVTPTTSGQPSMCCRTGATGRSATSVRLTSTTGSRCSRSRWARCPVRHCNALLRGPLRRAIKDRGIPQKNFDR